MCDNAPFIRSFIRPDLVVIRALVFYIYIIYIHIKLHTLRIPFDRFDQKQDWRVGRAGVLVICDGVRCGRGGGGLMRTRVVYWEARI